MAAPTAPLFSTFDKELSQFLYIQGVHDLKDVTIENYADIFDITPVSSPHSFVIRGENDTYISLNTRLDMKYQKQEFFLGIVQILMLRKEGVFKALSSPASVEKYYHLRLRALCLALPYHLKPNSEDLSYSDFLDLCEELHFTSDFLCPRLDSTN